MTAARPLCKCHGQAMYRNGVWWRCAVKVRDRQRHADIAYWHRADGGYVTRRRRMLADQRTRIVDELDQLEREAATC